jgi:hypothetical protein
MLEHIIDITRDPLVSQELLVSQPERAVSHHLPRRIQSRDAL